MKGAFINPTYLAKFVIFPFISTRLTEIYVEQLYQLHDISIPFIYILITLLSIEEQLLVFKQQQSIQVYEEFEIFSQSIQNFNLEFNNPFELSNQVNSLIQQHGFDLKQNITTTLTTEQLNNAKEDQYLTNKEVNNNMNHSIPYELILQSSYHDISLINKKFNTHRISKVYFPNHHLDQHIFQHSGLSYLNLVKSEQLQLQDCYNMIYGQNLQISCEDSFYASNLIQQQNSSYQDYYKKIFAIQEESTFSLDLLQTFLDSNYAINPLNIQSYDTLESSNNIKHYAYMPSYILYPHNYEIIKVYHNNLLASTQQDQSTLCLGELFDQEEKKLPRINFLQNKQISIVSYQGGTIHNNVLIRGMSKHLNQNLQNTLLHHIQNSSLNNEDQIKRLQIALGLLDNTRLFSYAGVYQGFDQNIMKTPQFIINYLLLDNINSTQQIQHIPLEQLLKYCASYELFIYMQVFRQNVTNNLQFSQVNNRFYSAQIDFIITNIQSLQDFSDSAQFSMMFFEKVQLQSLSDRFLPNRFISFFELMITYYFENNPSQAQKCKNLISTPLFYTKMIASDNHLLFLLLCNNKFVKSSQILQQVLIKQQSLISKDVKILQITQFNHFFLSLLRTISINSKAELLEQDQIIISKECISKIQNEIFFDHKFMLPGPKFLDLDQKIFNSQLLYKQISIKKDSSFQKPSSPVKPIKIELKQQHLQISLPSLPFNPQNIAIKQEELQKLSPQVETLKIQTHKLVVQENMNQVLFFDQILLKADRNQVQHAIRRIISHYSCRSYYFKKNLLYVPNVRIISAEDAISHQIGFKVNDYDPKNSSQQNFDILLQILTNDFQLQNKNKTPNIHKFCTVFNEEIKKKLDAVCFLPQLNLEFYKNFNVFSQWIIKRTLQAECDLNRGLMVVFDQDPVMGINLNQKQEWNQLSNKYKFSIFTDSIYSLSDSKALQLYNQLKSECDQYDKEYRDRQLLMLIKIGIGTGSTPLETYYRFIQKDDPYKVSKSLTSFVNLLTLCFEKKLEFPYKVPSVTANMEEFQQSLYRLEHMRFLHIKLQQFDFLQWLSRLSELKASSITIQEKEHIQIIIQRQMCNNITKLYPDYAENLTVEEEKSVKLIGDQASLIDASNQVLWKVDIKFNEFLPENDPKYNMLRHFKLEFFAINDYEQSYVRKAWEITLQYKLLFIALFGTSRQDIERLINQQNGILPLDQQMIEHVFKQIQSLWSRLHDFILMHIITDMGYTEAMMQSIVGKDTRQKSKHVEFLRQGFFVDEESFNITQTPLYYIFVEVKNAIPDTSQQPIILNTATLNEYLSIKQHLVQPTIQQIIKAITILRSKNPDEIFVPISVSKELLTRRVEHIAHALRCERILACDPLQKYLQDKAVSLAPIYPQMKPFIEPKILPVQPVIKIEAEPLQKSMKIKKIPALQIPNVSQILTQKVPNIQFLAPQNESIHPSKLAARVIKNTKLQFYLQPKTEILEFVGDLINNSTHIQNIDVFLITQILQDPTTEWARLYTFLINFQPKPSKYTEIYKKIAVKTGETDSYRIVAKGKQHFELVESFILDQIDAAYSVAYAMRKAIIEGVKCEELKGKIHNNLKIAAIWGQELVFQCLKDKMEYQQKLCLSLYFMLSEEVE
ncbi:hypothetical protein SS50377_27017 [Spironucleus salmonicida]|nr:hypothetical protein SS50377_27017 [Spironucleus salmonicida]